MSQPYLGEIRMAGFFAQNNLPPGWKFCNGELLKIAEYKELYELIKKTYGGDDSHFALPDLRGRVPLHRSKWYAPGASGGHEDVTLTPDQVPGHVHNIFASCNPVDKESPEDNSFGTFEPEDGINLYRFMQKGEEYQAFSPEAVSFTRDESHTNMQPYQTINFIIAVRGITPTL